MSTAYETTLEDVLFDKYQALREDIGPRYDSVMEGYGHMVSVLNTVEAFFKDCKKEVHKFVPSDSPIMMEATRDQLTSMEHGAVLLDNAALAMAARMRLFRDTVVDMAGGDLLDMIQEETENQEEQGTTFFLLKGSEGKTDEEE